MNYKRIEEALERDQEEEIYTLPTYTDKELDNMGLSSPQLTYVDNKTTYRCGVNTPVDPKVMKALRKQWDERDRLEAEKRKQQEENDE